MSHSFVSGLVVKKLNSVVKLMGKCLGPEGVVRKATLGYLLHYR